MLQIPFANTIPRTHETGPVHMHLSDDQSSFSDAEVISMIVSSLKTGTCFSVNLQSKVSLSTVSLHKVN